VRRRGILLLLAILLSGSTVVAGPSPSMARADAAPLYRPADPLRGASRGSTQRARWFAHHYGALRGDDLDRYVREVYRLAPEVGLDPAIVIAQSALETDTWRTAYWRDHLNPAGIGITHDGAPSFTWANGADAARGQIVHLYLYAVGKIPAGHVLAPYKHLDPRYDAAVSAGYAGSAETIADLSGTWATDPNYAEKIAGRGNDIFIRHRLLTIGGSTNANDPRQADDANAVTAWRTTALNPPSAELWVDLGSPRSIGTIRWLFKQTGYADRMVIQVSDDRTSWRRIATVTNGPTLAWQGLATNATGRYVRFRLVNQNGDAKLGMLAEVQVWPPTSPPLPTTN